MIYKLELNKERLNVYIRAMDSAIRVLGSRLANAQNAPLELKNILNELTELNNELNELDKLIDSQTEKTSA